MLCISFNIILCISVWLYRHFFFLNRGLYNKIQAYTINIIQFINNFNNSSNLFTKTYTSESPETIAHPRDVPAYPKAFQQVN